MKFPWNFPRLPVSSQVFSGITTAITAEIRHQFRFLLRFLKWFTVVFVLMTGLLLGYIFLAPLTWKLRFAHQMAWLCRQPWQTGLNALVMQMVEDFEEHRPEQYLEHFASIPPQLRFYVFHLLPPDIQGNLLEQMVTVQEQRHGGQSPPLHGVLHKTLPVYRLSSGDISEPLASPATETLPRGFYVRARELGQQWWDSLTPEEKTLALDLHRQWFAPSLSLRHDDAVWVVSDQLDPLNAQFRRYALFRQAFAAHGDFPALFIAPFPGELAFPRDVQVYETDGLFIAPRRNSCDCATDVDCLPDWHCQPPVPGLLPDELTCCQVLGVLLPCTGSCHPSF
jgi:hypothetical protein